MHTIFNSLKKNKYKKIKFKISSTNHITIKASINGIIGDFILDTGASSSCVSSLDIDFFNLTAIESDTRASGAGSSGMITQMAKNNTLKIGKWKSKNTDLIILDLSHVNNALTQYKAKTIHGIIGADVLQKGMAIIDYHNKHIYLNHKK